MVFTFFERYPDAELMLRLLLAIVCGLLTGTERSRHHKSAGIRTYLIVAAGAAIYAMVSKYGFLDIIVADGEPHVDVSRVAASIVTGVGFLGAGAIFMRENHVEGLATAAGMWVMAAVGAAFGVGMYATGFIVTAIVLIVQILFQNERMPHLAITDVGRLVVTMDEDMGALKILEAMLYERNIDIVTTHLKRHKDGTITYSFSIVMPESLNVTETVTQIYRATGAKSIDL